MKIAFYEITENWQEDYLRAKLFGHQLYFYGAAFSDTSLPNKDAEVISTFTNSPVTPKVLEHAKNLKLVTTRTTGFDHIDLAACAEKKITVSNVPFYGENTVAEFTFALLLALSRKVYPAIKRVREEGLFNYDNLRGFDLLGKTIGVVGTGHIGQCVLKIAKGFGLEILAYDPYPKDSLAKDLGFKYVSLDELLASSDIITLHVPYMPETHHLINKDNIRLCKKGSVLVNTARGGLVDTESLVWALQNNILAGAALDVLEEEGFIKDEAHLLGQGHPNEQQLKTVLADHELVYMDNVIITPHNAFNTIEAMKRILDTTVENIQAFAAGKPINIVKK